ncbi:MAG: ABC transporter ATP-binding protein [Lautropia sp.]
MAAQPAPQPDLLAPLHDILRAYWQSDRWTILLVAVVVLLASTTAVAGPYLFSRLIDRLPQQDDIGALAWAFVGYAALLGLASALGRTVQYLSFMSAENLGFIASTRFFERILRKTAGFFVEHNAAEIQSASVRGRSALSMLVQLGLVAFIPGAVQILLALAAVGALIDVEVAGIVLVYGACVVALGLTAERQSRVYLDRATEAGQQNARFVGSAMNAMETLRHFGRREWIGTRFSARAAEVRDNWRAYVLHRLGYLLALGFGLAVQFAVTLLLLLPRYREGLLTIGDLVLFNTLLLQLNMPFEMIGHAIGEVARARSALLPLATMWAAPEERSSPSASAFASRTGRIDFDSVGYAYGDGRGIRSLSFTARRDGITFLVGPTGSGKTTVFRLALKSIEPQSGRILVDGVDLASIEPTAWSACAAVVPQDVVLLNESLADNILLGRPRDDVRLRAAAADAAALTFIQALPEDFDTIVGERGMKLSGGERQRVAIARALYGDPAILFLDEASSALDEATERDIMDHVRRLARDVTVLAITHRRTVITATDTVIDLGTPA